MRTSFPFVPTVFWFLGSTEVWFCSMGMMAEEIAKLVGVLFDEKALFAPTLRSVVKSGIMEPKSTEEDCDFKGLPPKDKDVEKRLMGFLLSEPSLELYGNLLLRFMVILRQRQKTLYGLKFPPIRLL
ncbi:hypothetical protein L1887_03659 [Cichorium endivia]|nr:hypothetical protein L1887_03659 [Cichorium endivia]